MKLTTKIPIALLLVWLTVSLGAILPTTTIKFNTSLSQKHVPVVVAPPNKKSEFFSYFTYFFQAILIGVFAIVVVGIFIYRREFIKEAILAVISLFLILLIFGFIYFLANKVSFLLYSNRQSPPHHPYSIPTYANNIIFLVILSILIGVLLGLFVVTIYRKREVRIEEKLITTQEVVEKAIYHIKIGKDIRGAILSAYKEMEKLMRSKGVEDKDYYTPREFREFSLKILKISEKPINILTNLFEIARYSHHEMNEDHRTLALKALEEIKNETRRAGSS